LSFWGGMGWMLGLMTGNRSGVSIVPLLVFSLPILPSKSFSLISKLKVKPTHQTLRTYKKPYPQKRQRFILRGIQFSWLWFKWLNTELAESS